VKKPSGKTTPTTTTTKPQFTTYKQSLSMFTTEDNLHTFSFEKKYYTRAIEFSDFIRTELKDTEPIVIYFLNEISKDGVKNTIGATLPIWLNKVPAAVSGVVYDTTLFKKNMFEQDIPCSNGSCKNLCSKDRRLNVTCYLIDEHGILVTTSSNNPLVEKRIGMPFYKLNPWLMKRLELMGIYEKVISGKTLKECHKPSAEESSGVILKSFFNAFKYLFKFVSFLYVSAVDAVRFVETNQMRIDTFNDIIEKQSNCYYFGIYALNIKKARSLNAAELDTWCAPKRYLVGYVQKSNLLMLVVEDELNLTRCGNVQDKIINTVDDLESNNNNNFNSAQNNTDSLEEENFLSLKVNRYRKPPPFCHNKYPNESILLPCANSYYVKKSSLFMIIFILVLQNVVSVF
jgi:hypothetical protein